MSGNPIWVGWLLSFSFCFACGQSLQHWPEDPLAILNVKTELGAVGDGVADDTNALQKAIETCFTERSNRFIYLPKGIYKITRPLVFQRNAERSKSMVGPWIFGESREGTVILLGKDAKGFDNPEEPQALIRGLNRPDGARMNADFFDRMVCNLTLDTGGKLGAVGIAFYSNNSGTLRDVTIRGGGRTGLELGTHDQNGPLLIRDVRIEGFHTGIRLAHGINSQTLWNVEIVGCQVGVDHMQQVAVFEGLKIHGVRQPFLFRGGGAIALLDVAVIGGLGEASLIREAFRQEPARDGARETRDAPLLYMRNLRVEGYGGGLLAGASSSSWQLDAYSSQGVVSLYPTVHAAGLMLEAVDPPRVPWENDPEKWVCANDFGMTAGSKEAGENDDALAIQAAIDHAAAIGASTVYIRGHPIGPRNWYHIRSDIRIHGSVCRLIGIGFTRLLAGIKKPWENPGFPEQMPRILVEDEPAGPPAVVIDHISVHSHTPGFVIEVAAKERPVLVENCHPVVVAREGSTVFLNNNVGQVFVEPDAIVLARHLNTESKGVQNVNRGGALRITGFKTERSGTKLKTIDGGVTEVFGSLIYNNTGDLQGLPCLEVQDAYLFSGALREVHWKEQWYEVFVRAEQAGELRTIDRKLWQSWSALRVGEIPDE